MRKLAIAGIALLLASCSTAQLDTARQYQADVAAACKVAMGALESPVGIALSAASGVGPWIVGGCATEIAVAKLALDPTSLAWVDELIAKARKRAA